MPDATREERLEFYAKAIAQTTEFWREGRHYVGIMHFAGLTYSKPNAGGATSDILMPDITDPTVRPCIKEAFRNARIGRRPSARALSKSCPLPSSMT